FVYWAFTHAAWWYVIILECPNITLRVKPTSDGVIVKWSSTPQPNLRSALGFSALDTEFYVKTLHGQFQINSPVPLVSHSYLTQRINCTGYRIVKIPIV